MQKLWKQHQKFMAGNAGFSLVELIIVIAIMAALVAILAPQYIKYVEKSRQSVDISAVDNMMQTAKALTVDPDTYEECADGFVITWDADDDSVSITDGENPLADSQDELNSMIGATVAHKSKDFGGVTITYDADTLTYTVGGGSGYITKAFTAAADDDAE